MEENKEMMELLKQIEKNSRRQARTGKLLCVFALAMALCGAVCVVLVVSILPQLTGILSQVDTVAVQMQSVLGNLEQTTAQLAALDFGSMVSDVDALVVTGQQSLEMTMEKLNSIDFQTLNQAIKDLADVVEPLAKLTNMFK